MALSLQDGKYVWQTYKEVYDYVVKLGNAMRSCGFGEVRLYKILFDFSLCMGKGKSLVQTSQTY